MNTRSVFFSIMATFRVGDRVRFKYNYSDEDTDLCTIRAPTTEKPANATVLCVLAVPPDSAACEAFVDHACSTSVVLQTMRHHIAQECHDLRAHLVEQRTPSIYCVHWDYTQECGSFGISRSGAFCVTHYGVYECGDEELGHDMPVDIGWTCIFTAIE